jgi:SAM-dependent methyltransferase
MIEQKSQFETESLASIMRDQAVQRSVDAVFQAKETQSLRDAAADVQNDALATENQAAFNGTTVRAIERVIQDLRGLDSKLASVEGRMAVASQQRTLLDDVAADLDGKIAELDERIGDIAETNDALATKLERKLSDIWARLDENKLFAEDVSRRAESTASIASELESRHASELKALRDQVSSEASDAAESARALATKSKEDAEHLRAELKAVRDQLLTEVAAVAVTGNDLAVKLGQELSEVRTKVHENGLFAEEVSHRAESAASIVSNMETRHDSESKLLRDQLLPEVAAAREVLRVELQQVQQRLEKQQGSLIAAMHEWTKGVDGSSTQTTNQVAALADDLELVRIRLLRAERALRGAWMKTAKPTVPVAASPDRAAVHPDTPAFDYLLFEKQFRGPRDDLKIKQSRYIDLFRGCRNILDLGCGRGEFLELMGQSNLVATGVDNNQDMVDLCAERGLTVTSANIFDYLNNVSDGSVDGFFCAQVVEHLPPEKILELMHLCFQKAQRGAVMVCETVNPSCSYALSEFWLDPTHVRPVPAKLLRFMAQQAGFQVRSVIFSAPMPKEKVEPQLEVTGSIPDEVQAYRDYAIVARRG